MKKTLWFLLCFVLTGCASNDVKIAEAEAAEAQANSLSAMTAAAYTGCKVEKWEADACAKDANPAGCMGLVRRSQEECAKAAGDDLKAVVAEMHSQPPHGPGWGDFGLAVVNGIVGGFGYGAIYGTVREMSKTNRVGYENIQAPGAVDNSRTTITRDSGNSTVSNTRNETTTTRVQGNLVNGDWDQSQINQWTDSFNQTLPENCTVIVLPTFGFSAETGAVTGFRVECV